MEWLQAVSAWDFDKGKKRVEMKLSILGKKKKKGSMELGEIGTLILREAAEKDRAKCGTTPWLFR